MKTVLVVGSSGFIGRNVVAEFKKNRNIFVIGIDKLPPDQKGVYEPHIYINADANNINLLEKIFQEYNIDVVVNLVGLPHVPTCERNPHASYIVNVVTAHTILEAMRRTGPRKYIFASSAAVYGERERVEVVNEESETNPTTIYGWHKLEAELEAKAYANQYGFDVIVLRVFNVYGSDLTHGKDVASIFLKKILNKEKITIIAPRRVRDFIYVEDVAKAFAAAALHENLHNYVVINVGSGRPIRIIELLKTLENILGKTAIYEVTDPHLETGYYASIERLKRLLGIEPRKLEDGIKAWLQKLGILKHS